MTRNLVRSNQRKGLRAVAILILLAFCLAEQTFGAPLLTRWAAQVSPTNVHPEYPRPQLVRAAWQNLNGLWDYQITTNSHAPSGEYEGQILVPFPIESHLSGVTRGMDERSTLWYRRPFTVPEAWRGKRVHLHFGAVDWSATVSLNGQLLGVHRGGYDRFSFDATPAINWEGENELVVAVQDPTEGDQPRGKQTRRVEGIFYTPSSGIWQTVWLEPVDQDYIQGLSFVPDLEKGVLRINVMANTLADRLWTEVIVSFQGREVGKGSGVPGIEIEIPLREMHPWSPAAPNLYDVSVALRRGNGICDQVGSYFGLREIRAGTNKSGGRCLLLNGEPFFQMGVLDQGFWPDGLYTAPTDEALRFDLETAKKLGFNLIRKHVKVEPERWYYWADKLGLLVWQDMPSGNNMDEVGRRQFQLELDRMIDQKANHPCIVMWVLFNEGWGQFDTERLARRIKAADPTRLVNSASGWTDLKVGDVIDVHSYPQPLAPTAEPVRAGVLGEFGGLGLGITNHTWSSRPPWGYQLLPDSEQLTDEYVVLLEKVWKLQEVQHLAAAVYTQLTDVETECNGFLTYDREILKMDEGRVRRVNLQLPKILPDARDGLYPWHYTTSDPGAGWMQPEFDVAGWKRDDGGFGAPDPPGSIIKTEWKTPDIWLRREFELKPGFAAPNLLLMYHDEDAEVYINGVPLVAVKHFTVRYKEFKIPAEARKAFRTGRNVLAIHCRQSSGGQYIDAGLLFDPEEK